MFSQAYHSRDIANNFLAGKHYAVLCSYSNNIEDVRHIAVAISLDDAVFITVNHFSVYFYQIMHLYSLPELQEGSGGRVEAATLSQIPNKCLLQRVQCCSDLSSVKPQRMESNI